MTGEKLKRIITENGYTLASAARLLGMSSQHLNQALSVADVKSGLLEKVSETFGISITALYGETQGMAITGNGSGVNVNNNDSAVVNRFLSIIEEKDRQIAQLLKLLDK
jgi:transcriptional regulator with XRE-family HTH domain